MEGPSTLLDPLRVERISTGTYSADLLPMTRDRLVGGGLLAAALLTAADTASAAMAPPSLHAVFLKRSQPTTPVMLGVDDLQTGRTTCTRLVALRQGDTPLMTATARFVRTGTGDDWNLEEKALVGPGEGGRQRCRRCRS